MVCDGDWMDWEGSFQNLNYLKWADSVNWKALDINQKLFNVYVFSEVFVDLPIAILLNINSEYNQQSFHNDNWEYIAIKTRC